MYTDKSLEDLLPCDLFLKKMIVIKRRTSIPWSMTQVMKTPLTSDKEVDEDSWTFMENPIHDMSEEQNNEPETFDGFVDNHIYAISN